MSTIFKKIIDKEVPAEIIYEDADFIAFMDIFPIKKGHFLLVPKIEVDKFYDLPEDIYTKLFLKVKELIQKCEAPLIEKLDIKRVGIAVEGFGVPHAHVHFIPLHTGQEMNPEKTYKADEAELREMADFYRKIFMIN